VPVSGFVVSSAHHLVAAGDPLVVVVALRLLWLWPPELASLSRQVRYRAFATWPGSSEDELGLIIARKQPRLSTTPCRAGEPACERERPAGDLALNLGGTLNLLEAVQASAWPPASG